MKKQEFKKNWFPWLDDLDDVSFDSLQFVLQEGKQMLAESIRIYDHTTGKAYNLITIYGAVLGAMVTFFGSSFLAGYDKTKLGIIIILLLSLFPIGYCVFRLMGMIFPNKLMVDGRQPTKLLLPVLIEISPKEDQLLYLVFSECNHLQTKINYNFALNNQRLKILQKVITISLTTFLVLLILLIIFYFT